MTVLRVALAQLNPTVGDLDGNLKKLMEAYDQADEAGCDLVAYPELSITGYPPEDLVLKPGFVADNRAALESLSKRITTSKSNSFRSCCNQKPSIAPRSSA